eukprot:5372382-Alexandrium_andersonii.AAC.1
MERPLRASQTAGHHANRCSADISPTPHSGQQPAGCGAALQWAVQAAGASRPPKSRARATQAA